MLAQLDTATREDLYRLLAELLWHELQEQQERPNEQEAAAPVARDLESPAA